MSQLEVIILSNNKDNFIACAKSVREHERDAGIILVENGMNLDFLPMHELQPWLCSRQPPEPFIFSRNVNIGIAIADKTDVVLMNDDAILKTPGGLSVMQKACDEHPEYGLIGSTCNNIGNSNQFPKKIGLRDEPTMVCFVCVFIPRRTIDRVGNLDERFLGYGFEDDAYCQRVREAGLKIGIHDGCFVDHRSLPSTFRSKKYPTELFQKNKEIFAQYYGRENLRVIS